MQASILANDRGSVLVLGIGLMGVIVLALSVAVDASLAFVQRSTIQARADAAVLAGVQTIDLDAYYATGATAATRLSAEEARSRTLQHLDRAQRASTIEGLTVVAVSASQSDVSAVIAAPLRTAFWPIQATIQVQARAQLDYVG